MPAMACARCLEARKAAVSAAKQAAKGNIKAAAASAKQAFDHARESDRVRAITRRK